MSVFLLYVMKISLNTDGKQLPHTQTKQHEVYIMSLGLGFNT